MSPRRRRGRPPHPDVLTPAEWRVAEAARHGMTNPGIARRLGISVDAVKFHVSNALTKLGFARRSELRQWDGVDAGSALHAHASGSARTVREGDGAPDPAAAADWGRLGQISRSVADVDAATAWYRDRLGLPFLFAAPGLAFFDCAGTRLMLAQGDGAAASLLYFRVDDIRGAHRRLLARGIVFVAAPHRIHRHPDGTEEWMAFFDDNEGRPLAILAQVPPPALPGDHTDD